MGRTDCKCTVFIFRHPWWRRWAGEYQNFPSKNVYSNFAFQAFPPANTIFAGIGVLLLVSVLHRPSPCATYLTHVAPQAAKDASASQDKLIELFNRIERFFRRLEIYTGITPTTAMTDIVIEIMVEVLTILAIATKEAKSGQLSELTSRRFIILD
jgi:hypothetical protein